jgi:hypothetical protein
MNWANTIIGAIPISVYGWLMYRYGRHSTLRRLSEACEESSVPELALFGRLIRREIKVWPFS